VFKVYLVFLAILFFPLCCVNINCHIAYSFTDIFLFTLVAPHGLQNLGGACFLMYAFRVMIITIEIQIHAYIKGELAINFGLHKLLTFICKPKLGCHQAPKRGRLKKVHLPPMWVLVY